ncbi:MAG TPA: glycosyltransferase, partial [Pyrinomonadaceae bacterium]|nr:glycosyltransferase [Pyrinomonadaceae bacterium]
MNRTHADNLIRSTVASGKDSSRLTICFIYSGNICERSADPLFELKAVAAAARLGHRVTLVIPKENESSSIRFNKALQDSSISELFDVVRLPRPTVFRRGRRSFALLAAGWAKTQKYDLAWSKDIYAADASSVLGLNTIAEHHGILSQRQLRVTKRMIVRHTFKAFIAISENHKRLLAAAGLPHDKFLVAHNGVDINQFRASNGSNHRRDSFRPAVVYAGSLYPGRGIEQIFAAASRLTQVNFTCIGGRNVEISRYRSEVSSKVIPNVRFVGHIPHRDIPSYLSSADILIAPYTKDCQAIDGALTIDYASPMKLFEYMASGKPIVASGVGAIREVLQ